MPKSRIKARYRTLASVADIARIDGYDCQMLATVEACITTLEQECGLEFQGCYFWHCKETSMDIAMYHFKCPLLIGNPDAEFDSQCLIQRTKDILESREKHGLNY